MTSPNQQTHSQLEITSASNVQINPPPKGFKRASAIAPKDFEWLWKGRIPVGCISIIEGDTGVGKSLLTLDLAAAITTGKSYPYRDNIGPSGGVILLTSEDAEAEYTIPNLVAADANIQRVLLSKELRLPSDFDSLETAIQNVEARLLVINPINDFFECSLESNQKLLSAFFKQLSHLASKYRLAVVLVRNVTKNTSAKLQHQGAGSYRFGGFARSVLLLTATEETYVTKVAMVKSLGEKHTATKFKTFKKKINESSATRKEGIAIDWNAFRFEKAFTRAKTAIAEATDFLISELRNGRVSSTEIIRLGKEAGIPEKTLRTAQRGLGIVPRKYEVKNEWYWELPQYSPKATLVELFYPTVKLCVHVSGRKPCVPPPSYSLISVVKWQIDGSPAVDIECCDEEMTLTISSGDEVASIEMSDPKSFDKFRSIMQSHGIVWSDPDFAKLSECS